jgi:Gas vesicle protein K
MERQAVRRMEERTLTPDEIEAVGVALMRLEDIVHQIAEQFGLNPADLNLDLGPLGTLT